MKKLLILLFLIPISLSAQEKYFHELKGLEDSTGTTHLFYRVMDSESRFIFTNHIYHLNINSSIDSIFFYDETLEEGDPDFLGIFYPYQGILEYSFLENSVNKPFFTRHTVFTPPVEYFYGYEVFDWNYKKIAVGGTPHIPLYSPSIIFSRAIISQKELALVFDISSNPGLECCISFLSNLEENDNYELVNANILSENPINGDLIGTRNDSLFLFNKELILISALKSPLTIENEERHQYFDFYFNSDNSFYIRNKKAPLSNPGYIQQKHFSDLYRVYLENDELKIDLVKDEGYFFTMTNDPFDSDLLYISDSNKLLSSDDFGLNFIEFLEMDSLITGLYKKPNSDILYVLTSDELFEVNTETGEINSLKKLPVSNEEPNEVPNSTTIHQNYPNPFNPTTTISFELNKPAEVRLTVFDALGRTVVTLVNEQKSAGLHSIEFDASNLSSGIYFYRLDSGEFSQTKRLTLIK